jgi:hypothetical protein
VPQPRSQIGLRLAQWRLISGRPVAPLDMTRVGDLQVPSASHLADSVEERAAIGDAVVDEVAGEGELIGIRAAAQHAQQHGDLGREQQPLPVDEGEDRAPAQLVLRQHAASIGGVPYEKGERTTQAFQQSGAPSRVACSERSLDWLLRAELQVFSQRLSVLDPPCHARADARRPARR